jgi:hypothetical protein
MNVAWYEKCYNEHSVPVSLSYMTSFTSLHYNFQSPASSGPCEKSSAFPSSVTVTPHLLVALGRQTVNLAMSVSSVPSRSSPALWVSVSVTLRISCVFVT